MLATRLKPDRRVLIYFRLVRLSLQLLTLESLCLSMLLFSVGASLAGDKGMDQFYVD